ncbi:hypothetical protein V6N11_049235 [Hibiscus sabdariffa]|uniref:SLC26A/SulP transporter domain-containing protein n=1 Tax=Hibiscus sabdariffa TaxID=183260 RepID=A0ABR2P028_9ROSI
MSETIVASCLMVLALTMMMKYNEVDVHIVYSVNFEQIYRKWGEYLVSICALKGMTTSLLNVVRKMRRFRSHPLRAAEMFMEAVKIGLTFAFVALTVAIPISLSFGSTKGSHLDGNNEMNYMVFMNLAVDELDFLASLPLLLDKTIDHSNLEYKVQSNVTNPSREGINKNGQTKEMVSKSDLTAKSQHQAKQ